MPIYAYRCNACGFSKDVLQKMRDDPLKVCPSCNEEAFAKQITAAGFQLKGSGWYVTDFKGGGSSSDKSAKSSDSATGSASANTSSSTGSSAD